MITGWYHDISCQWPTAWQKGTWEELSFPTTFVHSFWAFSILIWAFLLISLFHCEASRLTNPENAGDRFTKGASCNQRQLLDVKCDFHPSFTRVVTRVTVSMRAFLPNMSGWNLALKEGWKLAISHLAHPWYLPWTFGVCGIIASIYGLWVIGKRLTLSWIHSVVSPTLPPSNTGRRRTLMLTPCLFRCWWR